MHVNKIKYKKGNELKRKWKKCKSLIKISKYIKICGFTPANSKKQ